MKSVLPEKGGGDAALTTGRTARFKENLPDWLALSDCKYLVRSSDKGFTDIGSVSGKNLCFSCEDIFTFTADNIGGYSGSWQSAKLFRTDRNPSRFPESSQAKFVGLTGAVVPGTQADKTSADEIYGGRGSLHGLLADL
jgi:hypothetical protein